MPLSATERPRYKHKKSLLNTVGLWIERVVGMAISGMDFGGGNNHRGEVKEKAGAQSRVVYVETPPRKKSEFMSGFGKAMGVVLGIMAGFMVIGLLVTFAWNANRSSIQDTNSGSYRSSSDEYDSSDASRRDSSYEERSTEWVPAFGPGFEMTGYHLESDSGKTKVVGKLRNMGEDVSGHIEVCFFMFDSDGNRLCSAYADKDDGFSSGDVWEYSAEPDEVIDASSVGKCGMAYVRVNDIQYFNNLTVYHLNEVNHTVAEPGRDDFSVSISYATANTGSFESPFLAVYFTFKNTDESDSDGFSFNDKARIKVFQNGVECEQTFDNDLYYDAETDILTGASIRACSTFVLKDMSSDVEVKVLPRFADGQLETVTYSFE